MKQAVRKKRSDEKLMLVRKEAGWQEETLGHGEDTRSAEQQTWIDVRWSSRVWNWAGQDQGTRDRERESTVTEEPS